MPNLGSPRVEGDEEEENTDDLEREFDIGDSGRGNLHSTAEGMLSTRLNFGPDLQTHIPSELAASSAVPKIPLLTYGQEVNDSDKLGFLLHYVSFDLRAAVCFCRMSGFPLISML